MLIHDLCAALDNAQVAYAVVGGYAVALHGAVRGTADVDIILKWTLENLQNAEKALKGMGLIPSIPTSSENIFHFREEYIQNRHLIAWNFYDPRNPLHQVDIIINHDLNPSSKTKMIRSRQGKIRILALLDLIKMKKASGRPQDLEDVRALESL